MRRSAGRTFQKYGRSILEIPLSSRKLFTETAINFPLLKSWIDSCFDTHGSDCGKEFQKVKIEGLKLIDVETQCVVMAPNPEFEYAALSYVFGPTKPGDSVFGELLPTLPKTIKDSLDVTRNLGLKYLWVDRYCIRQDDALEKYDQIRRMHLIFRQAHVTIVAPGNGPDHGIPGMSGPQREYQPRAVIDNHSYAVVSDPHLERYTTKWYSRAWTYQEEFLSRRLLYFLDGQTYFRCNQTGEYGVEDPIRNLEEGLSPLHGLTTEESQHFGYETTFQSSKFRANQHIYEISKRDISYEEDILNTLEGIFEYEKERGAILGHLCGIPIYPLSKRESPLTTSTGKDWEDALITGICWMIGVKRRRKGFPSWSWAAWKGTHMSQGGMEH